MKKTALALVMVTCASAAFAIDFHAGLGYTAGYVAKTITTTATGVSGTIVGNGVPLGVKAFFDATYVEASVSYSAVLGLHASSSFTVLGVPSTTDTDITASVGNLTLALFGRYPFTLGSVTIAPMLGVEYSINLVDTVSGTDLRAGATSQELADLNAFWVVAGVAVEMAFSPKFFVRPELLIGYKFLSKSESDSISTAPAGVTVGMVNLAAEISVLFGYRI